MKIMRFNENAKRLLLALIGLASCAALAAEKRPMALLVMLDGLRADAVENGQMPNLMRLRNGAWKPGYGCAWTMSGFVNAGVNPESAPNHVSIATGVTYLKHKVTANGKTASGDYANYPTWLKRIVTANPDRHALFAYSWSEDGQLGPSDDVEYVTGTDAENAAAVAARLAADDAPDATMFYINCPDSGGHASGYYPYGAGYVDNVAAADGYIGACIDAIAHRPTFAEEDWLILVTSDHGGISTSHSKDYGRHSMTVPVIVAGQNVSAGPARGVVYNYDLTANALAHFGLDAATLSLDARAVTGAAAATRPLSDGLSVYLPFDDFENRAADDTVTAVPNDATKSTIVDNGFTGRGLNIASGGHVKLEGSKDLPFEDNGKSFAITVWVRQNQSSFYVNRQWVDPAIWGNKNWADGGTKGLVLIASRGNADVADRGIAFNYVDNKRHDIGQFCNEGASLWNFYAVTRTDDGVLRFYQGRRDGRLHWVSDTASADFTLSQSGYPFYLGTDGTGAYKYKYVGAMDEFALWTRGLSHEEIRRVYEIGRRGQELGDVLAADALETPTVSVESYDGTTATLAFGGTRTAPYTLCVASGATDAGDDKYGWDHFDTVGEIAANVTQHVFALPDAFTSERRKFRFFLLKTADLPYAKELDYLQSAGTSAINTGICPRSGTSIALDVMSTAKNDIFDWFFGSYWNNGASGFKAGNFGMSFQSRDGRTFHHEITGANVFPRPYALNTRYHVEFSVTSLRINGEPEPTGQVKSGFLEHGYPIELFRNRVNLAAYDTTLKGWIGDVTLRAEGETVRALVPVEDLEGNGAYFDRVTGRLFPEVAGTALTLGPERETARLGWVRAVSPTLDGDASRVVEAVWTGLGETSALENPGNWACTNAIGTAVVDGLPTSDTVVRVRDFSTFSVPAGATLPHAGKIDMNGVRLTGDCDLSGLDVTEIAEDSVIDANGHKLSFGCASEVNVTLTFTDTSAGSRPGELHLFVPSGKTARIASTFAITGWLKLVKDGPGALSSKVVCRDYQGGTVVAEGTLELDAAITAKALPFGPAGSSITVDEGAAYDPKGFAGTELYLIVLNGGTFSNSAAGTIGSMTLTADSAIDLPDVSASHDLAVKANSVWDLGGRTLTITTAGADPDVLFSESGVKIKNGTLVSTCDQAGFFFMNATIDMSEDVTFDVSSHLRLQATGCKVRNLINRTPYNDVASFTKKYEGTKCFMGVSGRFTPLSSYCYFVQMADGSTLDLRARSGVWSVKTSVAITTHKFDTWTAFDADATITVDLAGRNDLAAGVKVIDFASTAVPDSTVFVPDAETAKIYMFERRADGLYLAAEVSAATWTGAADDGNVGNPQNWSCFDAAGKPVADALPGMSTKVTVSGETALNIVDSSFQCESIVFQNVSLTNDCDWSAITVPFSGSVDLKGHDLVFPPRDDAFAVTDTGRMEGDEPICGKLRLGVSAGTFESTVLTLSGGLTLVKEGAGVLVMKGAGQSHRGGTVVDAGTLRCGVSPTASVTPFGQAGTSITVESGAVFDPYGCTGIENYLIMLNGGSFVNNSGPTATIGNLTQTADSTILLPDAKNSNDINVKANSVWDLGGKTLTVTFTGGDDDLYFNATGIKIKNGKIVNTGDGYFNFKEPVDMSEGVTLDIATHLRLHKDGTLIENLINRTPYSDVTSKTSGNTGTACYMQLSGRFTPLSNYCYFMRMLDGATIDLGAKTAAWPVSTAVKYSSASYTTWTTFADNATIWIDLGGRQVRHGEQIVSWTAATKPTNLNTLKFKLANAKYGALVARDTGLYLSRPLMVIFR